MLTTVVLSLSGFLAAAVVVESDVAGALESVVTISLFFSFVRMLSKAEVVEAGSKAKSGIPEAVVVAGTD